MTNWRPCLSVTTKLVELNSPGSQSDSELYVKTTLLIARIPRWHTGQNSTDRWSNKECSMWKIVHICTSKKSTYLYTAQVHLSLEKSCCGKPWVPLCASQKTFILLNGLVTACIYKSQQTGRAFCKINNVHLFADLVQIQVQKKHCQRHKGLWFGWFWHYLRQKRQRMLTLTPTLKITKNHQQQYHINTNIYINKMACTICTYLISSVTRVTSFKSQHYQWLSEW